MVLYTPISTKVNNPKDNAPVERVHQVIYKILGTNDLDDKVFDYIYPWDETLASIEFMIRAYYLQTVGTHQAKLSLSEMWYSTSRNSLAGEL